LKRKSYSEASLQARRALKGTRNWAGKENMALTSITDADKDLHAEGNTDELEAYALLLAEVQSAQLTGSSQHEILGQWSQIHNQPLSFPETRSSRQFKAKVEVSRSPLLGPFVWIPSEFFIKAHNLLPKQETSTSSSAEVDLDASSTNFSKREVRAGHASEPARGGNSISMRKISRNSYSQPILLELKAPVKVCEIQSPLHDRWRFADIRTKIVGDIHGQYYDLLRILSTADFPLVDYLFLGNYVDYGKQSWKLYAFCLPIR